MTAPKEPPLYIKLTTDASASMRCNLPGALYRSLLRQNASDLGVVASDVPPIPAASFTPMPGGSYRATPDQERWIANVIRAGGLAGVAHNPDEARAVVGIAGGRLL